MSVNRRKFITLAATGAVAMTLPACAPKTGKLKMHGMIGKIRTVAGQRDNLISILLQGVSGMPGCLSYVVAQDVADADVIWVTEIWDSPDSHKASLSLPSVRDAISQGKPLIASFEQSVPTVPVGGHGMPENA